MSGTMSSTMAVHPQTAIRTCCSTIIYTLILVSTFYSPVVSFSNVVTRPTSRSPSSPRHVSASVENVEVVVETKAAGGALCRTIDELGTILGGNGRARIAWDCYSIGIDPQLFYSGQLSVEDESADSILSLLPSKRQSQTLGKDALEKLLEINGGTSVEGGVATLTHVSSSRDGTTKLLLKLQDGFEVETVLIPDYASNKTTVCISSQVGCRQACTFCATGRMGKLRSLDADEILAQLFFAVKKCRTSSDGGTFLPPVRNVVFMGMGEPGDNVENVKVAANIMTTRELFQLSAQRVTVSTVAPTPDTFLQLADANCMLAWSVHAARDELRKQLVPTTKYTMVELRQGLIDALLSRKSPIMRTVMFEIALMHEVNDSMREADELADFCRELMTQVPNCKLIVNLIPFNDIGQDLYQKPTMAAVEAFRQRLLGQGIYSRIRVTRGDDESAACGQLATSKKKKKDTSASEAPPRP